MTFLLQIVSLKKMNFQDNTILNNTNISLSVSEILFSILFVIYAQQLGDFKPDLTN